MHIGVARLVTVGQITFNNIFFRGDRCYRHAYPTLSSDRLNIEIVGIKFH